MKAYSELENELGHSASDKEVADRLGISVQELNKLLGEVSLTSMVSMRILEQNYEIGVSSSSGSADEKPEYLEMAELRDIGGRNKQAS